METYQVRVADAKGRRSVVRRSGAQLEMVLRDLHQEGYFVLGVDEGRAPSQAKGRAISPKVLIELTQTLANLLGNGLTLGEALSLARDVFPTGPLKGVLTDLASRVGKGQSLHDALSAWGKGLPPLYLGLIRIGEKTGDLSRVLGRLDEYLQARKQIADKTGNALAYPLLVMGIAVVGMTLLMTTVFPALTEIVASVNQGAAANYARGLSGFQTTAALVAGTVVLLAVAVAALRWRARSQPQLRERLDALWLRVPLAGPFALHEFGWNASFALETLLAAGYSVEDGLTEVSGVVANRFLRSRLVRVRERVIKGEALSQALTAEGGFPATFISWIAVGEAANDLGKSFGQLRRYYQQEWEKTMARWLALVEPGLILVVGAVLLGLILTFVTPVFSMLGNIL